MLVSDGIGFICIVNGVFIVGVIKINYKQVDGVLWSQSYPDVFFILASSIAEGSGEPLDPPINPKGGGVAS